jgi:hypothetical protein
MDKIIIFNNSKKIENILIEDSLSGISELRDIGRLYLDRNGFIDSCVQKSLQKNRNQVNYLEFLKQFIPSIINLKSVDSSKSIVLIDEDLYGDEKTDWVFGGFSSLSKGGCILISTYRGRQKKH